MKAIGLAAAAALVAVARIADAHSAGSSQPVDDEAARATAEARALMAMMETNAEQARGAHRAARASRLREVIACTNDALSRADVAARRGRESADRLSRAWREGSVGDARAALVQVRMRATASREAALLAASCARPAEVRVEGDRTIVTLKVEPAIVAFDPDFPPAR